jgi:hypothetical protein
VSEFGFSLSELSVTRSIDFRQSIRDEEDKVFETRRQMIQRRRNPNQSAPPYFYRFFPQALISRKSIIVTTAFSIFIGIFAYYFKNHNALHVDVIR